MLNLFRKFRCWSNLRPSAVLVLLTLGLVTASGASGVQDRPLSSIAERTLAFRPGETLTYDISWSNIVTAGTAVVKVNRDRLPDNREVLVFTVVGHSVGVVDSVFRVDDSVRSVFDPQTMQSLSYSLAEHYGAKKRNREVVFDRAHHTVVSRLNNDLPETFDVPEQVLDVLSTLYYIRTLDDFTPGKTTTIDVHESGKNWSVEVQILGRERTKTPAGEFDTIEIRTYPRYQGVFLNKGEVFLWLTNDSRRIPVLMKSKLKVGAFVFALTGMKMEDKRQ